MEQQVDPQNSQVAAPGNQSQINSYKLQAFMEGARESQNLTLAILAGGAAAVLAAVVWAAITVYTDYQIGWMAIGIGFLVGYAIRRLGKGIDKIYGFTGAVLSLLGCILGNLLCGAVWIAQAESISIFAVLTAFILSPSITLEVMVTTFQPIDLLFYGLAVYNGYRLSFRRFSQAELESLK